MPLDYSERKIWSVLVHGFSATEINDTQAASTGVVIYLSADGDEGMPGPKIDLSFAFPASHDSTLQTLQSEALACAAAILSRLGRETAETLSAADKERGKKSLLKEVS